MYTPFQAATGETPTGETRKYHYLCTVMTNIDPEYLRPLLLHRTNESHKGNYGHLLIVAGCQRMPGAAVLATGAALRSGCGLVTVHSTERALQAVVDNFPSAMLSEEDSRPYFSHVPAGLDRYSAIAVGPGLGRDNLTAAALFQLIAAAKEADIPMVLDADALNILAEQPARLPGIPAGSVLTPHLGELRCLVPFKPGNEEIAARELSGISGCVVVMKGFHTRVFHPGTDLVNTTGNPGLAKGGSGDVLTGLIGGLMARGYPALDAAALGVWLHGFAGDNLTEERTAEAWSSRDLIDRLYLGFKALY